MNLYVAGWDLSEQDQTRAIRCLQDISKDYPSLDADTIWRTPAGPAFAACVHSNATTSGSRQYLYQQSDEIIFFDGCMVDIDGQVDAMRANNLAVTWESLPDRLEGVYSVIRIQPQIPTMELLTDFLGMAQVFQAVVHGKPVMSNSVRILTRICRDSTLDPLGVSIALSLGWVSGDRTLNQAVQIVPSGTHWQWTMRGENTPVQLGRSTHMDHITPGNKTISPQEARLLSERMIRMLYSLGNQYTLQCPVTGGRDSRLLLSLLLKGSLPAEYYTDASTGQDDVTTAINIAERFKLPLRIHTPDDQLLKDQWNVWVSKLVRQNDGLVSLWQIADVIHEKREPVEMPVRLYGIGGEVARRFYPNPELFLLKGNDVNGCIKWMNKQTLSNQQGLVKDAAIELAHQFMRDWVTQKIDEGHSIAEIPDYFYLSERVRRWAGGNSRKIQESLDLFAPLCTRPFVEAAFRLPVWNRFAEPIHYQIIRLIPELHRIPFGGTPWPTQIHGLALPQLIARKKVLKPLLSRLHQPNHTAKGGVFDIHQVINTKRQILRSFCLDHSSSPLWDFINRNHFEQLTDSTPHVEYPENNTSIICQIATLFYYDALQDQTKLPTSLPEQTTELFKNS